MGRVQIAVSVLLLLLLKTLVVAVPVVCAISIILLPIQTPDLLAEMEGQRYAFFAMCLVYASFQTWFWARQLIAWNFGPPGTYLGYDMMSKSFYLVPNPRIEPKTNYVRPIVLAGSDGGTLILVARAQLMRIAMLYGLLAFYPFLMMLHFKVANTDMAFLLVAVNIAGAVYIAYATYNILSDWYWDNRVIGPSSLNEIYGLRRQVHATAINSSLLRFLFCRLSSLLLIPLSSLPWMLVVYSSYRPGHIASFVGAEGILFLALGSMIAVGALAAIILSSYGLPPLSSLLAWLIFLSVAAPVSHTVRTTDYDKHQKKSLSREFCSWLQVNRVEARWNEPGSSCTLTGLPPDKAIPIIFASASGGGLRASYWTASILGTMSDCVPRFDSALFSISAVSGGSLGAALYEITGRLLPEGDRRCDAGGGNDWTANGRSTHKFVARVLSHDFLGALTERLFFGDLVSALVPFRLLSTQRPLDRGDALIASWREAIDTECHNARLNCSGADPLSVPLIAWRTDSRWVPVSVFNSTLKETGSRLLNSTSSINSEAIDFHDVTQGDLTLGDAVLNSARFPIVSPAGELRSREDNAKFASRGHAIDGSYFDNSGARTTAEIASEVLSIAREHRINLKVIFLNLENDPAFWDTMRMSAKVADSFFRGNLHMTQFDAYAVMLKERAANPNIVQRDNGDVEGRFGLRLSGGGLLHELTVGIEGVWNAWDAQSGSMQRDLQPFYLSGAHEIDMRLCPGPAYSPTLGWKLGRGNRAVVDEVIAQQPTTKADPHAIATIFWFENSRVTDEELIKMRSEGGEGRMRAQELLDRSMLAAEEYNKLDSRYRQEFGKGPYGEGFGRMDMLGRTLTLNLCHNAVHEGIALTRQLLSN